MRSQSSHFISPFIPTLPFQGWKLWETNKNTSKCKTIECRQNKSSLVQKFVDSQPKSDQIISRGVFDEINKSLLPSPMQNASGSPYVIQIRVSIIRSTSITQQRLTAKEAGALASAKK